MAIVITDKGAYIEITNLDATKQEILKPYDIEIFQNYLIIKNSIDNLRLLYTDIGTPASANIEALRNTLMLYNNTGAPLATGSATSEKQDAQTVILGNILSNGAHTITTTAPSTSGSVAAGAFFVNIFTSADFEGTIRGVSRLQYTSYIFQAANNKTLPEIVYTITAGSLTIDKIV